MPSGGFRTAQPAPMYERMIAAERPNLHDRLAGVGLQARLVAAAAMTSADVTIAPSEAIGGVPVAALLRWDQPAEGTR